MAITTDIVRTWRGPRKVMRKLLDRDQREGQAFGYLMISCFLIFVAQWPRLSRTAAGFDLAPGTETPELTQLMAYEFLAWVMVWPFFLYVLAAGSHVVAKIFGGKGSWYSARMALFWSLLATVPVLMLHGLTTGFVGPSLQANLVGAIWIVAFAVIWLQSLREAESPQ